MKFEQRKSRQEIIILATIPAIVSVLFLLAIFIFGWNSEIVDKTAMAPGLIFPLWIIAFMWGANLL